MMVWGSALSSRRFLDPPAETREERARKAKAWCAGSSLGLFTLRRCKRYLLAVVLFDFIFFSCSYLAARAVIQQVASLEAHQRQRRKRRHRNTKDAEPRGPEVNTTLPTSISGDPLTNTTSTFNETAAFIGQNITDIAVGAVSATKEALAGTDRIIGIIMGASHSSEGSPIQETSSREQTLEELSEWASRYEIVAAMGYLATLLALGRAVNTFGKVAKIRFTPPAAVIAGFLGLMLTDIAGIFSSFLQVELESTMRSIEFNIVNFAFAALVLGFISQGKGKVTPRQVLGTIWHEGFPMLLYAQALIWGNSCVALGICGIYRLFDKSVSKYEGGLVTLGLEAGRDIVPSRVKFNEGSLALVHFADSAGLAISIVVGVLLVVFRRVSPNQKQEWFGVSTYGSKDGPITNREHFKRNVGDGAEAAAIQRGMFAYSKVDDAVDHPTAIDSMELKEGLGSRGMNDEGLGEESMPAVERVEKAVPGVEEAALGSHVSLIALSVFLGYILNLTLRYVEMTQPFLRNHHFVSGTRLFKVCMVAAACCMTTVRSISMLKFNSDWFHRIAGFSLDLMVTAAISTLRFDYYKKVQHRELAVLLVVGCVVWNLVAFFTFCRRMFPNYPYARGVTLMGDALGHSWVGFLLARTLDPQLQTPVPLAFTYKLLIFFIPGSGGKNSIVISLIDSCGEWVAFLVCLFMIWLWMHIFNRYYKRRFRAVRKDQAATAQKAAAYGDSRRRDSTDDETEIELLALSQQTKSPSMEVEEAPGMPTLSEPSGILSKQHLRKLVTALPERDSIRNWVKVFCMARDGANLGTLLYNCMACKKRSAFLIVVEDSWGYVFGGYVSVPLKTSSSYYGTGESFVFRFHPQFDVFRWTAKNEYFIISSTQNLAMGGGGGFAFQLDDELDTGVSGPSETYGNPRLSSRSHFRSHGQIGDVANWTCENSLTESDDKAMRKDN